TKTDQRYDMIYDLVGNHSFSERRNILKPNGICVLAGVGGAGLHPGMWGRVLGNFATVFKSKFTSQKFVFYIAKLTKDDLNVLRDLMQSGKVAPVIDRTYKIGAVVLATALYVILAPVNRGLALAGALFRVVFAMLWLIAPLNSLAALRLLGDSPYLKVFQADGLQALARVQIAGSFDDYYV